MSNRVDVDVKGFKALADKVIELGDDKDKRREALIILRQVAKPTLAASKALVPVSKERHFSRGKYIAPGALRKSLGFITARSENPTIAVGARAKGKRYDGWYAGFVHEGHEYVTGNNQQKSSRNKNSYSNIGKIRKGSSKNKYRLGKKEKARLRQVGMIKKTKAQPFLTNAYDQTKGAVTNDAERRFSAFLQRRINKLSQ